MLKLVCTTCGCDVSEPLKDTNDVFEIRQKYPNMQQGVMMRAPADDESFANFYVLNYSSMQETKSSAVCGGCCGGWAPVYCKNQHSLGTRFSDCFGDYTVISPNAVLLQAVPPGPTSI